MSSRPLVLAAFLTLVGILTVPRPARAALPVGFDLAAGVGLRGDIEKDRPTTLDLRVSADLRLGVLTLGGEFRDQPPWIGDSGANYGMGYFNLGLNIPLPKARIALRAGMGGGGDSRGAELFGFHESVGLHIFPKGPLGVGFQADFDQTFETEGWTVDKGAAGNVMLLFRI